VQPTKAGLRARLREARAAIPGPQRREAAVRVAAGVLGLLDGRMPRGVLAYAAMPEELDPSVLVGLLRRDDVRIAFPRVCGPGALALHWAGSEELAPGYCGLFEPPETCPEAGFAEIDLVLVPGVAFDAACHRLGMGGGFYDRLLHAIPTSVMTVGLAFDEQVVDAVPHEAHDAVLDAVVTPGRVLRRGSAPRVRP
jgi:5-formyltetrahydrofolate cyclo-ligase